MNEQYIKASLRERILLSELIKVRPDLCVISTTGVDRFDSYDALIASGNSVCMVETKTRMYDSTTYDTWMIEKAKYDYLMLHYKITGKIPLYICFHSNAYQIWNLATATEPIWQRSLLPINSQDKNPSIISKTNGDLHSKEAEVVLSYVPIAEATDKAFQLYQKYFK